ncbi:hypothetical protein GUJ93_ZPchr0008g12269 [Zizania palustris]|uniref:BHLH domain-containing protein n=1 Tax=Zizania palustris TaxID=103762 RepID=A0A8J5RDC9_ZIZPA|nr:hypothetical protein GUJ93_ZPchr0008g12269 [Zizania palustris]
MSLRCPPPLPASPLPTCPPPPPPLTLHRSIHRSVGQGERAKTAVAARARCDSVAACRRAARTVAQLLLLQCCCCVRSYTYTASDSPLGFPASFSVLNNPPRRFRFCRWPAYVMVTDGECSAAARKGARSHSEAERKRRQRINAHLATLRTLVPSASRVHELQLAGGWHVRVRTSVRGRRLTRWVSMCVQMDKAALLGEVVRYVRELRGRADDATEGVDVVPAEDDEVGVEDEADFHRLTDHGGVDIGGDRRWRRRVRAWVCCADRPGLMSDLGRAVRSVSARPVRAEVATVGGRTRSVLEVDVCDAAAATDNDRAVALSALRAALRTVLLNREELLAAADGYKRPRFSPRCTT